MMPNSLLIVTPQPSFGEYIRQSLEEVNPTDVEIVDNGVAALYKLENEHFTHAFLDRDLENESVSDLGLALRERAPNLHLVVISARESMPRFDALRPWSLLHKPFFLPDLLRILDGKSKPALSFQRDNEKKDIIEDSAEDDFFATKNANENNAEDDFFGQKDVSKKYAKDEEKTQAWITDLNKAGQHLTRLTLESSAQTALIIRRGEIWASSGRLSDTALAELVKIVIRDKKAGDLLKFLRLDATQAEHMLYATTIANTAVLVMIFDAETPFSAIRRQATHLAESLAFSLQEEEKQESPVVPEEISLQEKKDKGLIDLFDFDDEEYDDEDGDLPPISEILENIPDPIPVSVAPDVKAKASIGSPVSSKTPRYSLADEPMPKPFSSARVEVSEEPSRILSKEKSPAIRVSDFYEANNEIKIDLDETRVQEAQVVDLDETRVQEAQPHQSIGIDLNATRISKAHRPETPIQRPRPEEFVETRLQRAAKPEISKPAVIDTSTTGSYDLTYACLLVPRFSNHHLTGDIAERLSEWMPNICIAFGWRLEHLSVRPDYLQWVINVPPTTSPGYLMRIMRKQTSDQIFDDFPRQRKENPSGDFWAPGYLIMGGSQPHPSSLVKDYIKRTRERQGS